MCSKRCRLSVVEVTGQLDVSINVIDPSAAGFAVGAVFRVNYRMPQRYSGSLERPALAVGVHPRLRVTDCDRP
jgi:hypothetical protein